MDDLSRLKNSIDSARNIGILTKINANDDATGTTLALFFALKNINKNVFFAGEQMPEKITELLQGKEQKKFHISFKEDVSEVYYEKKDNGIDLYLTPKNSNVNEENFSCKMVSRIETLSNGSNYDLLITIGIQEFQEVESLCINNLDQLYGCDVINIDTNLGNQNYGEINLIEDGQSLSQYLSCTLNSLGKEYINKEVASFLLYGLISSNKNTSNKKNMPTIKWLFKHGGDLNLLSKNIPQIKLLELTLKNMSFIEDTNIYVSSLSEENMINNKATSKDLVFVVEKIKMFFRIPSFMLLWESRTSPLSVKGVIYSDRKIIVQKIIGNFKGISKGSGAMFATELPSIIIAKEKILSCIK
jgi:nanoRNase/pAp phosphatase (c-di-AMP/oligoRNAs hydrolase)